MKDLNTNQKIAIAAIVVGMFVAGFFWYNSPFNRCVRSYADTQEKLDKGLEGWSVQRCMAGN